MKTIEEQAAEFSKFDPATDIGTDLDSYRQGLFEGFLAGYQAAKEEEATKDQKIAALWTESIKKLISSVHEVVLVPSSLTETSEAIKARDAEIIAKMRTAVKKAKAEDI